MRAVKVRAIHPQAFKFQDSKFILTAHEALRIAAPVASGNSDSSGPAASSPTKNSLFAPGK